MKSVKIDYIPRYTYSDYINWEGRWELIDGVAYAMTPLPGIEHQEVSKRIIIQFSELLKECGKCKVLLPVDWKIDEDTVLQPDVSVVCNKVEGRYLTESPMIIFEILSPSTVFKDASSTMKCNTWEAERRNAILSVYGKTIQSPNLV